MRRVVGAPGHRGKRIGRRNVTVTSQRRVTLSTVFRVLSILRDSNGLTIKVGLVVVPIEEPTRWTRQWFSDRRESSHGTSQITT